MYEPLAKRASAIQELADALPEPPDSDLDARNLYLGVRLAALAAYARVACLHSVDVPEAADIDDLADALARLTAGQDAAAQIAAQLTADALPRLVADLEPATETDYEAALGLLLEEPDIASLVRVVAGVASATLPKDFNLCDALDALVLELLDGDSWPTTRLA